jgi:5,10-methylenetetrahydromethanopterin reductase
VIAATKEAEISGFDSVWVAEDYWTKRDGISVLSCLALSTNRIRVGTGVINPYIRHPILTAMTLNSLSELAQGRLILGIGSGMPWKPLIAAQMSQQTPLRAMREAVETIRDLMSGKEITWGEEVVSLTVSRKCFSGSIAPETQGVPIYMGASGPRMTELVGEIGDGLILGTGTSQSEIPSRLKLVAKGAEKSGRDHDSIDVAAIIVTSASADGKIDDNTLGYAAKHVAALEESDIQRLGFDPDRVSRVKEEYQQNNCQSAYRMLSPDIIAAFTAAGTPADCLRIIEGYAKKGVKLPILMPFGGDISSVIEVGVEYLKGGENNRRPS